MKEASVENLVRRGAGVGESSRGVEIPRRITPGSSGATADGTSFNKLEPQETNVGYASMYQRRRRLVERNAFQGLQTPQDAANQFSFSGHRYGIDGPQRKIPETIDRDARTTRGRVDVVKESALPDVGVVNYHTFRGSRGLSHSSERRKRSKSRSQERRYETETKTAPCTPKTSNNRDTYGTMYQRRRRLIEGNSFLALQTGTNGTTYYPQQMQNYTQMASGRLTPPHAANRSNRSDAARESVQKLPERDQGMMDIPTAHIRELKRGRGALQNSEIRLQRPRSRSEDNRLDGNDGTKMAAYPQHSPVTRHRDKAVVDDEDYDNQRQASSRTSVYEIQSTSSRNSQYQVTRAVHDATAYERDADRPTSGDSSSSNISITENHHSEIRRIIDDHEHSQDENQSSNSRSSTPHSQMTAAFDVMPLRAVSSRRNSVNSYHVSLNSKRSNLPDESIALEITDEDSSGSDVDVDDQTNELSVQDRISHDLENLNTGDETDSTFDSKLIRARDSMRIPSSRIISKESIRGTIPSKESLGSPRSSHSFQQLVEEGSISEESRETVVSTHGNDRVFQGYQLSPSDASRMVASASPRSSGSIAKTAPDSLDEEEEAILPIAIQDDNVSMQSLGSRSFQELDRPELYSNSNSASMGRSSHSHTNEHNELENVSREDNVLSERSVATPESRNSKTRSQTPTAKETTPIAQLPDVLPPVKSSLSERSESRNETDHQTNVAASRPGLQSSPTESSEPPRRQPSKVPRMKPKPRVNSMRTNPPPNQHSNKPLEKPKAAAQLCFSQMESKDWEVIAKGLKTLSQIAQQNPGQLESYGPGTLGRILGRHVGNLRSQVSRAACLAAGDVFMSQIKGIEQEIDDIAGPLLHRTADTNKFLRADSNAALDRLVESISPHKTIAVLVYRGGVHQNAIVRATTGRLLSDVVDRIGPDQAMNLPRDVRDKLLVTGAKLLLDGNLDARNYAKKIFRSLSHCEGFHKALTDAVPEATLRHIDKTLRAL